MPSAAHFVQLGQFTARKVSLGLVEWDDANQHGCMIVSLDAGTTWITTEEAAKALGLTMGRIRQLAMLGPRKGGLKAKRLTSRTLVFDKKDVEEFAARPKPKLGRPRGGFKKN